MLSEADNELLTKVGPGTPVGELFRRYWFPACLSSEVPQAGGSPLRLRLLGEDLIVFRDLTGQTGLVAENCPHRGASLYFGRNEEGPDGSCGLRCVYHGWQFDVDGNTIDVPSEPNPQGFVARVKLTAYPTHESGGLVWTYMGPADKQTPFRDFGTESLAESEYRAVRLLSECNWAQSIEGNIDTAHIGFLHQFNGVDDIADDGSDRPGYPANAMSWKFWRHDRAPRLEVENTWYGYKYAGIRTTPAGNTHVRVTAFALPAITMVASIPFTTNMAYIVPRDDVSTWRFGFNTRPPSNPRQLGGANLFSGTPFSVPRLQGQGGGGITPRDYTADNDYQIDRDVQRHSTFSGVKDFQAQDLMVTESMGPIYDRTKEHLGTTDLAVNRMRNLVIAAARNLAAGIEPPALGSEGDFTSIRGAEKILEPGEDWRVLGTNDDPVVAEALGLVIAD
jgi:phthalate 4,5-dioxygenase